MGSKSSHECYELEKPSFIFRKEISIAQDVRTRKERKGGGKPVLQNILCFPTLAQQAVVSTDLSEHSVKIIPTSNLSGLSAPVHGIVEIFIFHSDKKMPKIAHCLPRFSREEGPLVL